MSGPPTGVLWALAADGLDSRYDDGVDEPLDDRQWRWLRRQVVSQRLATVLLDAIEGQRVAATPAQRDDAFHLAVAHATHVLRIERLLLQIAAWLSAEGIDMRVLKGTAHAHLLYPDPSVRSFGDVDLLIPGARFADAVEVLAAQGLERTALELRPGFDARFGKGATLSSPVGIEVDLHRTFLAGPFAMTVDPDALFERAATFEVGGVELHALAREERFLHTCFHAALGGADARFVSMRDVAYAALDPELDDARVLELARQWHSQAVVAKAMTMTWSALGLTRPARLSTWSETYAATRRERRALAAYGATSRRWRRQALAAIPWVPGLGGKLAYMRALVQPDRRALASRGRSYRTFWGRRDGGGSR